MNHPLLALLLGVAAFALPFHSVVGLATISLLALLIVGLAWRAQIANDAAPARLARGKPPRKSAWRILAANVERLGEAYRADRRRRRRRRALAGRSL